MNTLLLVTQSAGILLLIGTMVLLFFRRVLLDAETKQPIRFKLPLLGEVSTQAPVMVLILVAAFMVIYPLSKTDVEMATVIGEVDTGDDPVSMLIVADPDYTHNQDANGAFEFSIPLLRSAAHYRIKYIVNKRIIDDQTAVLSGGKITLRTVQYVPPVTDPATDRIEPKKEISDEELRKFSIGR